MKSVTSFAVLGLFPLTLATQSPTTHCKPSTFSLPSLGPDTKVLSLTATPRRNHTIPSESSPSTLNFCQVAIHLTHTTSEDADTVLVEVWLPLDSEAWNGRLQATGGGGYASGMFDAYLAPAVHDGWAAVSTDGGVGRDPEGALNGSWALRADRTPNWGLLYNFASRSAAEQVVVGKAVAAQYYGRAPHHAYWNGCSTGGRQGFAVAQRWPRLLDGVLVGAPALSATALVGGMLWPQIVMRRERRWVSGCERAFWLARVVEECDVQDGVRDGVVADPGECVFDSRSLVGETFECDGVEEVFSEEASRVFEAIRAGPPGAGTYPLAFGMPLGAPLDSYASTSVFENGTRGPDIHPLLDSWFKYFVLKDPTADATNMTPSEFISHFGSTAHEYASLLNSDSPDLSALRDSGTKLLSWHGLSDQLIPYHVSLEYRKRVEAVMGGAQTVDEYFRYFLAPGVDHCAGGSGPAPKDPLTALVEWVENGVAPETLEAETRNERGELVTRELCAYPAKAKYMGIGDPNRASSWSCVGGTERVESGDTDGDAAGDVFGERATRKGWNEYEANFYGISDTVYRARDDVNGKYSADDKRKQGRESSNSRMQAVLGGLKDRIEGLGMGLRVD